MRYYFEKGPLGPRELDNNFISLMRRLERLSERIARIELGDEVKAGDISGPFIERMEGLVGTLESDTYYTTLVDHFQRDFDGRDFILPSADNLSLAFTDPSTVTEDVFDPEYAGDHKEAGRLSSDMVHSLASGVISGGGGRLCGRYRYANPGPADDYVRLGYRHCAGLVEVSRHSGPLPSDAGWLRDRFLEAEAMAGASGGWLSLFRQPPPPDNIVPDAVFSLTGNRMVDERLSEAIGNRTYYMGMTLHGSFAITCDEEPTSLRILERMGVRIYSLTREGGDFSWPDTVDVAYVLANGTFRYERYSGVYDLAARTCTFEVPRDIIMENSWDVTDPNTQPASYQVGYAAVVYERRDGGRVDLMAKALRIGTVINNILWDDDGLMPVQ